MEDSRTDAVLSPNDSLGFAVNRVARQLAAALHDRLRHLGVAPAQFGVLLLLYEADGRTQAELTEKFGVEQPTMARTLQRMERDGLIMRLPDPDDGRRTRIHLSPRAHDIGANLISEASEVNRCAADGVPGADLETFRVVLRQISDNLALGTMERDTPPPTG